MESKEKCKAAKVYLAQIGKREAELQSLQEVILRMKEQMQTPKASAFTSVKVKGSGKVDGFERGMIKLLDLEAKYNEIVFEYLIIRDKAIDQLMKVADPLQTDILFSRYFKGMDYRSIAKDMEVSLPYAFLLHDKALESFYDLHLSRQHSEQASEGAQHLA